MGGLKVIGVGFSRTGTLALKNVLDRLGLHCYHAFEIFKRPADATLWLRAIDEKENRRELFEQIFTSYEATVDFPSVYFYRDLIEYYPNAKIILTLRDSNAWYESFRDTVMDAATSIPYKIARRIHGYAIYQLMQKTFHCMVGNDPLDRQHMIQVYEQHNADVLKHVPAERLLIYRIEQGWKPICEFLNIPVPEDMPFPHINEREELRGKISKMKMLGWLYIFIAVIAIFLVIGLFYYCW